MLFLFGARASAAPMPATGSISGTVSLETGAGGDAGFVPAGSVIVVMVGRLSGNPDAPHLMFAGRATLPAPAAGKPAAFSIPELPLGEPLAITAEVHALNRGPHYWDVNLNRIDAGPNATVTLTAQHPQVTSVKFAAKGAGIPPNAAADGSVPLGSIFEVVELLRAGQSEPPGAFPPGLDIIAHAATDPTAMPLGVSTMQRQAGRVVFTLSGLPLETPLVLQLVVDDSARTTLPFQPYSHVVRPQMQLIDGAWNVTLNATKRDVVLPMDVLTKGSVAASPSATAAPPASGSFLARIALDGGTGAFAPAVDPNTVRVVAVRTDDGAAVGSIVAGPELQNPDGSHFFGVRVEKLPVGVPIAISIEVAQPTPLPTGFAILRRFRPKDGGMGSDAFALTLDPAHSVHAGIVDFVPYILEVPPLPQTAPTPLPATTGRG